MPLCHSANHSAGCELQEGYVAFFVEVHMSGPRLHLPFISTTEVVISPDTFPFPDCSGAGCKGTLV